MLNVNNNAAALKRDILVRITKMQLDGSLLKNIRYIPRELAPRDSKPMRCCIYHDREILKMRVAARMGFSVEDMTEDTELDELVSKADERAKPTWPMLTVLHEACNACVKTHYMVTNACQGCLARPCEVNCPKKAIAVGEDRHSHIDSSKCINCGLCMQNCPYHAIIKIPVPCEEACPVGAISKGEDGREHIDYDKCIFCGSCMRECPFSAMMDKSQLYDVVKHIMKGDKVVALYAPAIAGQFKIKAGQLKTAFEKLGFASSLEVAIGADICAEKEAKEFEERMERGDKMMTTSCCSAYVRAVNIHVPELSPCISDTRSPMHYTAEIAKKDDANCITVFVGPCLAKRREGFDDELVDYVLSAEELAAFIEAKEVNLASLEETKIENPPTASARNFAVTGGVAESVKIRLSDQSILRPVVIDGLNKAGMKTLAMYGKINSGSMATPANCPNLIEVMACEGGCIAGPSVIMNPKLGNVQLKKYVADGTPDKHSAL